MNGKEWKEKVEEICRELSETVSGAKSTLEDVQSDLEFLRDDILDDGEPDEDEVEEIDEFLETLTSACDDAIVEIDDLMGQLEEEV